MSSLINTIFTFVPILVIIAGCCSIIWPKTMWYLSEGWKYKNLEPSEATLVMTRIGGVIGIIAGIVFLTIFRNMPIGIH